MDIDVDAFDEGKLLLLRLLLLLLLYTGVVELAKPSSKPIIGILGNVCCVLLAFHLDKNLIISH